MWWATSYQMVDFAVEAATRHHLAAFRSAGGIAHTSAKEAFQTLQVGTCIVSAGIGFLVQKASLIGFGTAVTNTARMLGCCG
jgi:hypothetical protein